MSNATTGEFTLTAGGTAYRFKVGTAALELGQETIGQLTGKIPTVPEFVRGALNLDRMLYARIFIWAGLRKYHPEITQDAVPDILDSFDADSLRTLLVNLAQSTQADPRDAAAIDAASPADPPATQPVATTTTPSRGRVRSISRRAASG